MVMPGKKLNVSSRWIELCKTKTWIDLLDETAAKYPHAEALVFEGTHITYDEYRRQVNDFARGLYAIGVRPGDHVALWMTNRPEWCYARA